MVEKFQKKIYLPNNDFFETKEAFCCGGKQSQQFGYGLSQQKSESWE